MLFSTFVLLRYTANWKDPKIQARMLGVASYNTGGAVSGQVAFTPAQAKEIASRNDPCILVVRETHPGQEDLLQVSTVCPAID